MSIYNSNFITISYLICNTMPYLKFHYMPFDEVAEQPVEIK